MTVALGALCACGAAAPTAEDVASGRVRWDAMSAPQKTAYMEQVVLPRMRAVFTEFDPHRYPRMGCTPCHEADSATRGWKMPNPDLLVSKACISGSAQSLYGSEAAAAAMAKMTAFMRTRVQPEMASLLGKPADQEATGEGFGCFDCHTLERDNPVPVPPPPETAVR